MTSQPTHCIEVVVYRVKSSPAAAAARRSARPHIEAFPGFLGWQALTSSEDPLTFTDIVTWASLADAKAAGEKLMADPHCQPFMAEVAEVVSMGHYE